MNLKCFFGWFEETIMSPLLTISCRYFSSAKLAFNVNRNIARDFYSQTKFYFLEETMMSERRCFCWCGTVYCNLAIPYLGIQCQNCFHFFRRITTFTSLRDKWLSCLATNFIWRHEFQEMQASNVLGHSHDDWCLFRHCKFGCSRQKHLFEFFCAHVLAA